MKKLKTLLTFITILLTFSVYPQQVEIEMVVVEIFTSIEGNGYYCPGAALGADDLISNGKDVAIINYHTDESYGNDYATSRANFYSVTGLPRAFFNGYLNYLGGSNTQSMYPYYLPKYEEAKANLTSFTINATGESSGFLDFSAEITIEKVDEYGDPTLALHFVLTESNIQESWQGLSEVDYVERLMVPNQSGTLVDFTNSDTQIVNLNFSIEEDWVYENCEIVVFLEDNDNYTNVIRQCIKKPLSYFSSNEAEVTSIQNIPEANCSETVTPSVIIRNNSNIDLTQLDIHYYLNESDTTTVEWTGILSYNETTEVDLPLINFELLENNINTLTVYSTNPNGNPDQNPNNDTIKQFFESALTIDQTISFVLSLDNNPEEINWEIKRSNGETIYAGGPYTTPNQFISETFELDTIDCYSFTIYDEGGDGLISPGFFGLFYDNNVPIIQGGAFGSWASTEFKTEGFVNIDEKYIFNEMNIFPNPVSDKLNISFNLFETSDVNITVYDLLGKVVYETYEGVIHSGLKEYNINLGALDSGFYLLKVNVGNENFVKKISLK